MRFKENPIITPASIKPSQQDFEVACVLNPAVTTYNDEIILLMRVAQRPPQEKGYISALVLDLQNGGNKILRFKKDDPKLEILDSRVFRYDGIIYLTTMSHLQIARSKDAINFVVDDKPFIAPQGRDEQYGLEDARITKFGDTYYIYYVAASSYGISTVLATTKDWVTFERGDIIFPAMNKDVAIFPEKINGNYYALTRPDTEPYAAPSMWLACSPNLQNWGKHTFLISPRQGMWDSARIGAGTVPLKTNDGWLEIYHGANFKHEYCLGLLLLDSKKPEKIIHRSDQPIMQPEELYETQGFFSKVIFTNGMAEKNGSLYLYYGAADKYICGAKLTTQELLDNCKPRRNLSG